MPTDPLPARLSPLLSSPPARLALLGFLFLVLQVPLAMIDGVVREREGRRDEARAALAASWGGPQRLVGPLLRVACVHAWTRVDERGWRHAGETRSELVLLPESLAVDGTLNAGARQRGLFSLPVYTAALALSGRFPRPDAAACPQQPATLDLARSEVVLAVADPRGLRAETGLAWNGHTVALRPATALPGLFASGVHAPLGALAAPLAADGADFRLVIGLAGSAGLRLAPVGKETRVTLSADWPHPSFQGGWLPVESRIGDEGFAARWALTWLGRDFPQAWVAPAAQEEAIARALFGVDLVDPVDRYAMAARVAKYAVLTVLFALVALWLAETLGGRPIPAVQVGFVGAALCLFGLLQLALAEHIGFAGAYGLAAALVVGQVALYARSVLGSRRRALGLGAALAGLYAYLYAVLRAEDYALLAGALGLFALLGITMYLTRRIDWGRRPEPQAVSRQT